MDRTELSNKLDFIRREDLGIPFDEAMIWDRVQNKMAHGHRMAWVQRVAAVITLALLVAPLTFQQDREVYMKRADRAIPSETPVSAVVPTAPSASEITQEKERVFAASEPEIAVPIIERKGVTLAYAPIHAVVLRRVVQEMPAKKREQTFAEKDISIIQASLERRSIEQGRNMTIRAQWQKSPTKSNVEFQAFKIKLYEKNE